MTLVFELATEDDVAPLAALHSAVAGQLARDFGEGPWSASASEVGVARGIRTSSVVVARDGAGIAGTLRLAARKPLAIDSKYFRAVRKPLYLADMAVRPSAQRTGIGRLLLEQAVLIAREQTAGAIRLDAYDAPAGAGGFYAKCGFRDVGRATYRQVPLIYYEMLLEP